MNFYKTNTGEFLAIETNPHTGLEVRRRESYDVAPPGWLSSETELVDGVLMEVDDWGTTKTAVEPVSPEQVIAAWGFDPRTVRWSSLHRQWMVS
jgi:hypothetical protein